MNPTESCTITTPRPNIRLYEFVSPAAALQHTSEWITSLLKTALAASSSPLAATLLLSGGSTPAALYRALSQVALDWSRIAITLADERWTDTHSADSNAELLRQTLLLHEGKAGHFLSMHQAADITQAAADFSKQFEQLPQPPLLALLGMGNDGHTLSWFPGSEQLETALDVAAPANCMPLTPQSAPYQRLTLTYPVVARSQHRLLLIQGAEKRRVLASALEDNTLTDMPVRRLWSDSKQPLTIAWSPD